MVANPALDDALCDLALAEDAVIIRVTTEKAALAGSRLSMGRFVPPVDSISNGEDRLGDEPR